MGVHQVMFSSIAVLLGAPGQANYSAANAEMDSMAAGQQATGRPVTSVQWGAWAGAGMASKVRHTPEQHCLNTVAAVSVHARLKVLCSCCCGSVVCTRLSRDCASVCAEETLGI